MIKVLDQVQTTFHEKKATQDTIHQEVGCTIKKHRSLVFVQACQ